MGVFGVHVVVVGWRVPDGAAAVLHSPQVPFVQVLIWFNLQPVVLVSLAVQAVVCRCNKVVPEGAVPTDILVGVQERPEMER